METFASVKTIAAKNRKREPGSPELASLTNTLWETAQSWHVEPERRKFPVTEFRAGLRIISVIGVLVAGCGLLNSTIGLILGIVIVLLGIREWSHPFCARIFSKPGESVIIRVTARSKETQRVVISAGISTEGFLAGTPLWLPLTALLLGLSYLLLILLAVIIPSPLLIYGAFLPPLVLGVLSFQSVETTGGESIIPALALLELGYLLHKSQPLTTTVLLHFSGAQSQNSGRGAIAKNNAGPEQLQFQLELTAIAEGVALYSPPSNNPDQDLTEILDEVAQDKGLAVSSVKMPNPSPLAFIRPASQVMALTGAASGETEHELREFLAGVIRKLDQPRN